MGRVLALRGVSWEAGVGRMTARNGRIRKENIEKDHTYEGNGLGKKTQMETTGETKRCEDGEKEKNTNKHRIFADIFQSGCVFEKFRTLNYKLKTQN